MPPDGIDTNLVSMIKSSPVAPIRLAVTIIRRVGRVHGRSHMRRQKQLLLTQILIIHIRFSVSMIEYAVITSLSRVVG
jgi:hypothetical protein